jgi:hypothetical protein
MDELLARSSTKLQLSSTKMHNGCKLSYDNLTHGVGAVSSAVECSSGRQPLGSSQSGARQKGREQYQRLGGRSHGGRCSGS